ncbi:MAG: Acetoin utilization deacetylase AcuC or a related deacetylase [Methanophagales archaeon]|nr:Acetoin utilization deacetylase AcuC or a related deacetylase [Methanophagales archaeon]
MKMTGKSVFLYSDAYLKYNLGETHPLKPDRCKRTLEILRRLGVFDDENVMLVEPNPAAEEELKLIHSEEYINFVKRMSERGYGLLDLGDTPVTKGIYEGAVARVGGSLEGARLLAEGKATHAFNFGGGWHHAHRDGAAGFCVFNDVAIAARFLLKRGFRRIAIIDIDGHHGDGTQEAFYEESDVLTISFHRYGFGFYPGTGSTEEIGENEGKGYSVNVPLPAGTSDASYLFAFGEIVPPLLSAFKPEILIQQFGADAHYEDPLVGLALTTHAYEEIAKRMHALAHSLCEGRLLILGGGGYKPENVARIWSLAFLVISGAKCEKSAYEKLHDSVEVRRKASEKISNEVRKVVEEVKKKVFKFHGIG